MWCDWLMLYSLFFIQRNHRFVTMHRDHITVSPWNKNQQGPARTGIVLSNRTVHVLWLIDSAWVPKIQRLASLMIRIECVPYRNEFYQEAWAWAWAWTNAYCMILSLHWRAISKDGDFQFPRIVLCRKITTTTADAARQDPSNKQQATINRFFNMLCIQEGCVSSIRLPFLPLQFFLAWLWLWVWLSIHSFHYWWKWENNEQTEEEHDNDNGNDDDNEEPSSQQSDYSTYNLYLVYLQAIHSRSRSSWIFIFFGMYGSCANQKCNPNFYGSVIYDANRDRYERPSFDGACVVAWHGMAWHGMFDSSEWIYICFEIVISSAKDQPTHRVESIEGDDFAGGSGILYFVAIMVFIIHHYLMRSIGSDRINPKSRSRSIKRQKYHPSRPVPN